MQMVCNISDTEEQLTNHHLPAYLKEKLDIEEIQEGTVIKPLYMLEKEMIASALRISEGNLVQTAKLLEIGRSTLYRKIEKYKIEI
jgi:transcriptional regulator with PAS, ATPase and Fis domain